MRVQPGAPSPEAQEPLRARPCVVGGRARSSPVEGQLLGLRGDVRKGPEGAFSQGKRRTGKDHCYLRRGGPSVTGQRSVQIILGSSSQTWRCGGLPAGPDNVRVCELASKGPPSSVCVPGWRAGACLAPRGSFRRQPGALRVWVAQDGGFCWTLAFWKDAPTLITKCF